MTIVLKPENLFKGRKKALENALELFEDAKILYEADRYARTFFLIQIATEELGKYGIMLTSSISALNDSLDWKRFWQRFRDHKNKTEQMLLLEDLHRLLREDLFDIKKDKKYSTMQEKMKMESLYCDIINGSEEFILPTQIISKELCQEALKLLENRIDFINSYEINIASKLKFEKLQSDFIDTFYEKIGLSDIIKKRTDS